MTFLFEKDLVEQNLKLPFSNAESWKMGEDGISPQMREHFISKKYQRGKAMCQGDKHNSTILCLLLFPVTTLIPGVTGTWAVWAGRGREIIKIISPSGVQSLLKFLCPGFRSMSALQSYQEIPKTEMCGDQFHP